MVNTAPIVYEYKDEQNVTIFRKIRIDDGQSKTFYFEHEKDGKTVKGLEGCRRVLFNLPLVLYGIQERFTIFLVEGEKDALSLRRRSKIGTTAATTLEWKEEYTQILKEADVIILYDYDKTGLKRRDMLCKALYGQVKRLRVIDLPGLEYRDSHGQDITDWFELGNTIEQFNELIDLAPDYIPPVEPESINKNGALNLISIDELLALNLPPREMLLAPFLPSQGLVLIVAKRGVGKTHVALGISYAIATGGTFLGWKAPVPKKVLYIDGEMPATLMKERLQKIVIMSDKQHEDGFFNLLTPDLQKNVMPDLSHKKGRDAIEPYVQDCDLVVIDNISCLFRSGSENEAESWQEAQEWALDLRRRGKSVLFVHHAGKSGNQRGTSKKEDALDTVIILKQPDDYKAEHGAHFEIKFDKARHFSGDAARSFQVRLLEEDGRCRWEISNSSDESLLEQISSMRAQGYTIQAIVEKTGHTKSQVETLISKAKAKGLLT